MRSIPTVTPAPDKWPQRGEHSRTARDIPAGGGCGVVTRTGKDFTDTAYSMDNSLALNFSPLFLIDLGIGDAREDVVSLATILHRRAVDHQAD